MLPSLPPEAKVLFVGDQARQLTGEPCLKFSFSCIFSIFQRIIELEMLHEAKYLPSEDQAKSMMLSVWRFKLPTIRRFETSQTDIVLSIPPEAKYFPSGDQAKALIELPEGFNSVILLPSCPSQRIIFPSSPAEARVELVGDHLTTQPAIFEWTKIEWLFFSFVKSQTFIVPSKPEEAKRFPSGENERLFIEY